MRDDRIIAVALAALVLAAKAPVLATPFHWDEGLWIGFAHNLAELPLWRALPGLQQPLSALGGRPPGLALPMAALFKAVGPSIWLSHLFIACFAALGVSSTYLLGRHLFGRSAGLLGALFLLLSPLWFAQSAMFLADLPVAALGVTTVYLAVRGRYGPYLVCALYLLLLKETALALVGCVALYAAFERRADGVRAALREGLRYGAPLLAMLGWYGIQKLTTGRFFILYDFPFEPFQLGLDEVRRKFGFLVHCIFVAQHRWVFWLLIAANLALVPASRRRKELVLFGLIFASFGVSFVFLYFLPRYLLPIVPFLSLLGAWSLVTLVPWPWLRAGLAAAVAGLLLFSLGGSRPIANIEWDMGYLTVVRVHREMCELVESEFSEAKIAAAFPFDRYLRNPKLGYVGEPLDAWHSDRATLEEQEGAELVLYGSPGGREGADLAELAQRRGFRLIHRIELDGVEASLWGDVNHPATDAGARRSAP